MFLVLDNYDSFVHNLARYFECADEECEIVRSDKITINDIQEKKPKALILSPGPCTPNEAGICIEAVKKLGSKMPILGICLGHQAIGEAYGAKTEKAQKPIHGKASTIRHDEVGIYQGLPTPMQIGRYHSLIIHPPKKAEFNVTARTDDGEIMSIQHQNHPVYGLQFHPESILTPQGIKLIENFIAITHTWYADNKA